MQLHTGRHQRLPERLQISRAVAIVEEAGQAVVSTLHAVLRNVAQIEAGQASHPVGVPPLAPRAHRKVRSGCAPRMMGVSGTSTWPGRRRWFTARIRTGAYVVANAVERRSEA